MIREAERSDLGRIRTFLEGERAFNTFMLSDIDNYPLGGFMRLWFSEDSGGVDSAVLRFWNNLIIAGALPKGAVARTENIIGNYDINTVMGRRENLSALFSSLSSWKRADKKLYEASGNAPCRSIPYEIRTAGREDVSRIHSFLMGIPEIAPLYRDRGMIEKRLESGDGMHLFIEDEKGIAAHVNSSATNSMHAMTGGLAVREDMRGKGLALGLLTALERFHEERGIRLLSFTDRERNVFLDNGWVSIGEWTTFVRK